MAKEIIVSESKDLLAIHILQNGIANEIYQKDLDELDKNYGRTINPSNHVLTFRHPNTTQDRPIVADIFVPRSIAKPVSTFLIDKGYKIRDRTYFS